MSVLDFLKRLFGGAEDSFESRLAEFVSEENARPAEEAVARERTGSREKIAAARRTVELIADTFRARLGNVDLSGLLTKFDEGGTVESGELVPAADLLQRIGEVPGLARIMSRLGMNDGESFGHAAAALEFTLEGLYLMRRLSKDSSDGTSVYRT